MPRLRAHRTPCNKHVIRSFIFYGIQIGYKRVVITCANYKLKKAALIIDSFFQYQR